VKPPAACSIPARVRAAEQTRLRRLGLIPPAAVPGVVTDGGWVPPAAWLARGSGRRRTAPAQLRADLPWLRRMLEDAYIGWARAARRGWDWDAFFRRWDRHLRGLRGRSVPTAAAFAPWREFLAFQPDGHTGPLVPLGVGRGSQTLLLSPRASDRPATAVRIADGSTRPLRRRAPEYRPRRVRVWRDGRLEAGRLLSLPAVWGAVRAVRIGGRWWGAEPVRPTPRRAAPERPVWQRWSPGGSYLRIPTLNPENSRRLHRLAARVRPAGARLVVDLRGNAGGSATAAIAALRACLPDVAWTGSARIAWRWRDTAAARVLRWGWVQGRIVGGLKFRSDGTRRAAQKLLDLAGQPSSSALHSGGMPLISPGPVPRAPPILVLADGRCGSDGELLVWLLQQLPGVTVAGACTFGAVQFAQPGDGLLPHSRVSFRVALAETDLYGDGRAVDGHGLPVDIVLPDAASQAPDAIRALADVLLPRR